MGGIVISRLMKSGGNTINDAICQLVKQQHHLIIGDKTAEYLKLELARAIPDKGSKRTAYGRDLITGLPSHADIEEQLIFDAMKGYLFSVIEMIRRMMEKIPPELAADILENGIYFTGGTTLIPDLNKLFAASLHMNVIFSEKPLESVARGLGVILEDASAFKKITFSLRDTAFE
jgi:rod shape-determining protein MreB